MVALGKRKGCRSNGEMGVVTSGNVSIFRAPFHRTIVMLIVDWYRRRSKSISRFYIRDFSITMTIIDASTRVYSCCTSPCCKNNLQICNYHKRLAFQLGSLFERNLRNLNRVWRLCWRIQLCIIRNNIFSKRCMLSESSPRLKRFYVYYYSPMLSYYILERNGIYGFTSY